MMWRQCSSSSLVKRSGCSHVSCRVLLQPSLSVPEVDLRAQLWCSALCRAPGATSGLSGFFWLVQRWEKISCVGKIKLKPRTSRTAGWWLTYTDFKGKCSLKTAPLSSQNNPMFFQGRQRYLHPFLLHISHLEVIDVQEIKFCNGLKRHSTVSVHFGILGFGLVFFYVFLFNTLLSPSLLESVFICDFFKFCVHAAVCLYFFSSSAFLLLPLRGSYGILGISGHSYMKLMCVVHFHHWMAKKKDRLVFL